MPSPAMTGPLMRNAASDGDVGGCGAAMIPAGRSASARERTRGGTGDTASRGLGNDSTSPLLRSPRTPVNTRKRPLCGRRRRGRASTPHRRSGRHATRPGRRDRPRAHGLHDGQAPPNPQNWYRRCRWEGKGRLSTRTSSGQRSHKHCHGRVLAVPAPPARQAAVACTDTALVDAAGSSAPPLASCPAAPASCRAEPTSPRRRPRGQRPEYQCTGPTVASPITASIVMVIFSPLAASVTVAGVSWSNDPSTAYPRMLSPSSA